MDEHIIGNLKLIDCKITFDKNGHDNYIYCDNTFGDVVLEKCTIELKGSNSVLYLVGGNKKSYKFKSFQSSNTCVYIGRDTLFHKSANVHLTAGEESHIIVGNECMLANEVWVRTGDAHPVYSTKTHERINNAKSVIIGDHVWVAQDCLVFKGTIAGSGAIFGARSVLTGKTYLSNSSYAGQPAKMISEEGAVFFDKFEANLSTPERLAEYNYFESDKYIYQYSEKDNIIPSMLDFLENEKDVLKRIEFFKNMSKNKNRFAISSQAIINK